MEISSAEQHKYFSSPCERCIDRSHSCSLWIRIICRTKWEITLIPPALLQFIPSSIDLCERKELCRKHIYSSYQRQICYLLYSCAQKVFRGGLKNVDFYLKSVKKMMKNFLTASLQQGLGTVVNRSSYLLPLQRKYILSLLRDTKTNLSMAAKWKHVLY